MSLWKEGNERGRRRRVRRERGGRGARKKEGERERDHQSWEDRYVCVWGYEMGIPPAGALGGAQAMCSPVLGRGEARGAAAAIAGQRLNGGAHFVMAEGQEAAGRARVQHARAVEEGEAALGQGSLEGTGLALSAGSRQSGTSLPPPPENPQGVYVLILRADLSQ